MPLIPNKKWTRGFVFFFRLHWKDKLLAIEAVIFLTISRILIRVLPFRRITTLLSSSIVKKTATSKTGPQLPATIKKARRIGTALRILGPHLPWRCKCLEQAIAANLMLRLRGIHSTLYLGLDKNSSELNAHAWLSCGEEVITGQHEEGKYTKVYSLEDAESIEYTKNQGVSDNNETLKQ